MNNKQRMECLLAGGVPDVPPHWELAFKNTMASFLRSYP